MSHTKTALPVYTLALIAGAWVTLALFLAVVASVLTAKI